MIERYSGAPEDIGLDTLGFHFGTVMTRRTTA